MPPGQGTQAGYTGVTVGIRKNTLLQTARCVVYHGEKQARVRVLFDICSQFSFINDDLCQKLRLPTIRREFMILNGFESESDEKRKLRVVSVKLKGWEEPSVDVSLFAVPKICGPLNGQTIEFAKSTYPHLAGLSLADSSNSSSSLSVDILVGGDFYWKFFSGKIVRGISGPVASETSLGWVLSGSVDAPPAQVNVISASHTMLIRVSDRDSEIINKCHEFWNVENAGLESREEEILDNFNKSVQFVDQHYSVRLPFACDTSILPDNFSLCKTRLNTLIHKLSTDRSKLIEYDAIIRKWDEDGITENVDRNLETVGPVHYLPHRAVIKEDRATTKMRICMDASAHRRGSPSLNEVLEAGKCMLPKLFDVLVRWRVWKIALISDIKSAFLQIRVDEKDRDYLRFLWVDDVTKENPEIVAKRFTSVLFGLKSSPFLLGATLTYHINKYRDINAEFVEMFIRDLYMDDNTTGVNDVDVGFRYYLFIKSALLDAGFILRKWYSNSADLLRNINHHEETCYQEQIILPDDPTRHKVLGVIWDPSTDMLIFSVRDSMNEALKITRITKCTVLSVVAGIYDPLGILCALVIILKLLFQEVCAMKVDWDVQLSNDFTDRWISALQFLASFEPIRIPRHYLNGRNLVSASKIELHGFCDASLKAVAAIVYLRAVFSDKAECSIIAAKTKVVPLHQRKISKDGTDKRYTVPKLELSSCLILSGLMKSVLLSFGKIYGTPRVMCWTDSKDCVWWINSREKVRGRYVQPKVEKVRRNLPGVLSWNHCPGSINPADIPSRGATSVDDVVNMIHGPKFLHSTTDEFFPLTPDEPGDRTLKTDDLCTVNLVTETHPQDGEGLSALFGLESFSSFQRLLRVTCYVVRFIHNLKVKCNLASKSDIRGIPRLLHWREVESARLRWILDHQQVHFSSPQRLKELVYSLSLFRDEEGVLRVKGRLQFMSGNYDKRFPILLAKDSYLTELIIFDAHIHVHHQRVKDTLNHLRATYWVPQGRRMVKKVINKCKLCPKYDSKAFNTLPAAPLPEFRVQVGNAFSSTGVDYFGPLFVKNIFQDIDSDLYPVHVALYTCATSRAVHLDVVPNASCIAFVRSLKRFVNRYGLSKLYVSDNAKCFAGPELSSFLLKVESEWEFILSSSPWWGGYWERLVQSSKRCLRKIVGKAKLSYEELLTVLAEVEGVLNSRPLCHIYDDNVEEVLTPSHLILGRRLLSPTYETASPDTLEFSSEDLSRRAKYLHSLLEHFWEKWVNDYLTELREFHQCRNKIPEKQIQIGEVVLIHDKLKRNRWRMGVVEKMYEGRDGFKRGCRVRTITDKGRVSHVDRPVNKLYPLEVRSKEISEPSFHDTPIASHSPNYDIDTIEPLPVSTRPR